MSHTEFAELAGFRSIRHVGLLEEGQRANMSTKTAGQICELLGCSLDWLIAGKDPPPTIKGMKEAVERARSARTLKGTAA